MKSLTKSQWICLGKQLKRIHEVDHSKIDVGSLKKEKFKSDWGKVIQSFYQKVAANQSSLKFLFVLNDQKEIIEK